MRGAENAVQQRTAFSLSLSLGDFGSFRADELLAARFFFSSAWRRLRATRSLWHAMQYIPAEVLAKTSSSMRREQVLQVKQAAWYDSSPVMMASSRMGWPQTLQQ